MTDFYLAEIVERYPMELVVPQRDPGEKWFLDYVLATPRQAGRHLTAGWLAYRSLREYVDSAPRVFEAFGGLGAQSLMIQELWEPETHDVVEFDPAGVAHLQRVLPPVVGVAKGDSYNVPLPVVDLVGLDYGDLTAWKLRPGQKHRDLLEKTVNLRPAGFALTDVACRYLHLQRERYAGFLGGTFSSYPEYLNLLASYITVNFGYAPIAGFYDTWSTVISFMPLSDHPDPAAPWLRKTPENPVGLTLF